MIPFRRDEITHRLAGSDLTLRLHGDINFHFDKTGQFCKDICLLFSHRLTSYVS